MRVNLTKKDLVNLVYMQVGFSKQISENLIDEFFTLIISNLVKEKKIKISKFGTFSIRQKKPRIGRNPKTNEEKIISLREVVLFKPSKDFKKFINLDNNE
tara:strand:+ start:2579 stop:2878 length:300 start_codon:yes stop_codon:yes gene_type:complete